MKSHVIHEKVEGGGREIEAPKYDGVHFLANILDCQRLAIGTLGQ